MGFLTKAFAVFNKIKGNLNQPDQPSSAKSIISMVAGIGKFKIILAISPFVIVGFIMLVVTVSEAADLQQVQMNDLNIKEESSVKAGNINYTEADFQDAVNVTNSATIAGSVSEFASHLSGTDYKSLDGFNEAIKANVKKAGYGTREGVVAAAMTLSYEYSKATGYKLFYQLPGNRIPHESVVNGLTYLDCRAFVQWAVCNGGFKAIELDYITRVSLIGTPSSDIRNMKPGDIFSTSSTGHIWLVVGVSSDGYYAAEEYGSSNGLVINYYSFDNAYNGYPATFYDMTAYYSNPENVRSE